MEYEPIDLEIWGKVFHLTFSYRAYEKDAPPCPAQWQALTRFLCYSDELLAAAKEPMREFCIEANRSWFYDVGDDETGNQQDMIAEDYEGKLTDIFRVARPVEIYACYPHDEAAQERVIAVLFVHKFNDEDQGAILFRNERFERVCWDYEFL